MRPSEGEPLESGKDSISIEEVRVGVLHITVPREVAEKRVSTVVRGKRACMIVSEGRGKKRGKDCTELEVMMSYAQEEGQGV